MCLGQMSLGVSLEQYLRKGNFSVFPVWQDHQDPCGALGAPADTRHGLRTAQEVTGLNLPPAGHAGVTDEKLLLLLS